jgi:hypothetical protein
MPLVVPVPVKQMLSELIIDADKDWGEKRIFNIDTLTASGIIIDGGYVITSTPSNHGSPKRKRIKSIWWEAETKELVFEIEE